MRNNIISYNQMCQQQGSSSLQKGMNFQFRGSYSILLMSVRPNAPYRDKVLDDGKRLIYEGHDACSNGNNSPKEIDQPEFMDSGRYTENGKFHAAAQAFKQGKSRAVLVRYMKK